VADPAGARYTSFGGDGTLAGEGGARGAILGAMPDAAAAEPGGAVRLARLGGAAAFLGGLAWTVKGVVILAGGDQPPLLFELAPALFGVGLLSVAYSTMSPGRRRTVALAFGAAATVAGLAALVSDLVGEVAGGALAISTVALLIGLLTLTRNGRWPAPLAWWIGVALVPAFLVGGLLSEIDERLLEIPLICVGIAWMSVGLTGLRQQEVSPATH
jgi:hypothetical protein